VELRPKGDRYCDDSAECQANEADFTEQSFRHEAEYATGRAAVLVRHISNLGTVRLWLRKALFDFRRILFLFLRMEGHVVLPALAGIDELKRYVFADVFNV
jgi:hypothetical protein